MKRIPVPVWVISLYFGTTAIWAIFSYTRYLLTGEFMWGYAGLRLSSYGMAEWLLIYLHQFIAIIFCVLLLRMSKLALDAVMISIIISLISLGWFLYRTEFKSSVEFYGFVLGAGLFGIGLWGTVAIYVHNLVQKQVLK